MLPTVLDAAGVPLPETVEGVPQQRVEGTSMRYSFDDPAAEDRRRTQYFEMVGNRGIYHEGWTAVTRHGVPWKMTEEPRPFDDDTWELYDVGTDWSQAHDLAADDPERLARLQALFDEEAEKHQVFPLDDRVTERENPELAGRYDLHHGRTRMVLGRHTGRLSEEAAPNVKNRSHRISVQLDIPADHPPQSTNGVLVAQGGRFGGWSLYVVAGRPHYAYNRYGKDLTVVRAGSVLWPGEHEVVLDFEYDGGPPGSGGRARILIDGTRVRPRPDRGDHGVLLRLRRVLQRRHRPGQPGGGRLPAAAQRLHRRDPQSGRRPRRGHRAGRRRERGPAGQSRSPTERSAREPSWRRPRW